MQGGDRGLWTLEDLCLYLKIPEATARKWVRRKSQKLPVIRCGRLLRFRPAAIESWLADNTTSPRREQRRVR